MKNNGKEKIKGRKTINVPLLRFIEFNDEWEKHKFEEIITNHSFKKYLAKPNNTGEYEVIQQGDNPIVGLSNGIPFTNYHNIILFGDHTTSLYKPTKPFFIATDGVKILSADEMESNFLFAVLQRYNPGSQGYKRHFTILKHQYAWINKNIEEQTKIGLLFKQLDDIVTLHQRNLNLLKSQKQTLLSKVFPKDNEVYPEIRFKGFTDIWEQERFSDIFDLSVSNNTLSRSNLNYIKGEIKNIHYGDILVRYGSVVNVNDDIVPFVTDGKIEKYKCHLLKNGDVIIADTAEDDTTGKVVEINGINENYAIAGLHTIVARPINNFARNYLGYYLNSESYHKQLVPLMQGIKVLSLNKANLSMTTISYPNDTREQENIGIFFSQIDSLINLYQRELDVIKEMKKTLLKNMFV